MLEDEQTNMFKSRIHLLLALCVLGFLSTVLLAQGFESEIRAFEQADLASPPPANPVLFVGSSSIWQKAPKRGPGGARLRAVKSA